MDLLIVVYIFNKVHYHSGYIPPSSFAYRINSIKTSMVIKNVFPVFVFYIHECDCGDVN